MNQRRIVEEGLPVLHREGKKSLWNLRDDSRVSLVETVLSEMARLSTTSSPEALFFKRNAKKLVFCPVKPGTPGTCIAKVFVVGSLRRKLKYYLNYYRFALDEAANLLVAKDRGIHVPEVYGFGHIYSQSGLEEATVVLTEYLTDRIKVDEALKQCASDVAQLSRTLLRTVPVFAELYRAGCNHIDVNGANILLGRDQADSPPFLVDLQNAKFHDRPNADILMAEAGRLAKTCQPWVSGELRSRWLTKIFDDVGIGSATRSGLIQKFNYYFAENPSKEELKHVGFHR